MHEETPSALSSSTQHSTGSAGRNKVPGVQGIELQDRKVSASIENLKCQLSDRHDIDPSPLGWPPCEVFCSYGRQLQSKSASVPGDSKQATLMKGEDKLRSQEAIPSLNSIYEEVAVEQDGWTKVLEDHGHRYDQVADSNRAGPKLLE